MSEKMTKRQEGVWLGGSEKTIASTKTLLRVN